MNVTFAVIPMVIALTIRPVLLVTAAALTVVVVILAIALVFLHRRGGIGMSWKHICILIGSVVGVALLLPFLSKLGVPAQDFSLLAIGFVLFSIAWRRHFQGGCRRSKHPQK